MPRAAKEAPARMTKPASQGGDAAPESSETTAKEAVCPVRWFLRQGLSSGRSRALDGGRLWFGKGGTRWLLSSDGEGPFEAATEILGEDLAGGLPIDEGRFLFVSTKGTIFVTAGPLGDILERRMPPRPFTTVTIGRATIAAIDDNGNLCTLEGAYHSWSCSMLHNKWLLSSIALNETGAGLLVTGKGALFFSEDDGAIWSRAKGFPKAGYVMARAKGDLYASTRRDPRGFFKYSGGGTFAKGKSRLIGRKTGDRGKTYIADLIISEGSIHQLLIRQDHRCDAGGCDEQTHLFIRRRALAPDATTCFEVNLPWTEWRAGSFDGGIDARLLEGPKGPQVIIENSQNQETLLMDIDDDAGRLAALQRWSGDFWLVLAGRHTAVVRFIGDCWYRRPGEETLGPLGLTCSAAYLGGVDNILTVVEGIDDDTSAKVTQRGEHHEVLQQYVLPAVRDADFDSQRVFIGVDAEDRLIFRQHRALRASDRHGHATHLFWPFDPQGVAFYGRRGLAVDRQGQFHETADAGRTWQEVPGPFIRRIGPYSRIGIVCDERGCRTPWGYRLGWLLR
jgi:hypothetical protein